MQSYRSLSNATAWLPASKFWGERGGEQEKLGAKKEINICAKYTKIAIFILKLSNLDLFEYISNYWGQTGAGARKLKDMDVT